MQAFLHGGKIREGEAEDENGDELVALQNVDSGIDEQDGGESEDVPEALLGEEEGGRTRACRLKCQRLRRR